ncbi:hypothetical protein AMELA_G00164240 [Ameiurus melas]|uniref:Prolactin receptor n=1 Tax=Ameiurus melas TaxID=219545 RepID=A0A7J6AFL8_AMEME|nr:hypothetical protein AMELA_G00164240 [Ameiurus melas]
MLPVWCFSVLLLSAVPGLPHHTGDKQNSTSVLLQTAVLGLPLDAVDKPNSTSDRNKSYCNQTQGIPQSRPPVKSFWFPTMNIHRLDDVLRPGNEESVDTWSPKSPGK